MSESARLLVNADDFGLHKDIDYGILDCVERGRVQSVSFSPTGKSLDWRKLLELNRGGVRLGIHITLVGEPWGSDGRVVSDWKDLLRRLALQGRAMKDGIEREIRWQFQICGDNGLAPETLAHLDSHQHVHALAAVWDPCLRLAKEHGIPRIRVPWCPSLGVIKKSLAGMVLQTLAARRAKEVSQFLACLGIAHAGCNTVEILSDELACAARAGHPGVEMVVHPGRDTPELKSRYPDWQFHWSGERDALLSAQFIEGIAASGYAFAAPASGVNDGFSTKPAGTI
jgi:chitin disaccharide deacetylase